MGLFTYIGTIFDAAGKAATAPARKRLQKLFPKRRRLPSQRGPYERTVGRSRRGGAVTVKEVPVRPHVRDGKPVKRHTRKKA